MKVLITGTTSGIGEALLRHYHARGYEVLCVDRRLIPGRQESFPRGRFFSIDITDAHAVSEFIADRKRERSIPKLWFLNAGINRPDNINGFEVEVFAEIMRTNLDGVLNFVNALRANSLSNTRVVTLSSTSNFVPNPGHVGYHIHKLALKKAFALFEKNDPQNAYKTAVVGPVYTQISRGFESPRGVQGILFKMIAVSAEKCAVALARFAETDRKVFYFTKISFFVYSSARIVTALMPDLYRGTLATKSEGIDAT